MPIDSKFCTACGYSFNNDKQGAMPDAFHNNASANHFESSKYDGIVEKYIDYYKSEFTNIENENKSKFNWASFFLGMIHAAYRGVFDIWLKKTGIYMLIGYLLLFISSILLIIISNSAMGIMFFVCFLVACVLEILYFVKQIIFAKNFNKIYYDHVKAKLSKNNFQPDPSTGRAVITGIIFSIIICIISSVLYFSATLAMISFMISTDDVGTNENYYIEQPEYNYNDVVPETENEESDEQSSDEGINMLQLEISDIFVSSFEAVSWSISSEDGTYYLIPVGGDDSNIIFFNSSNEMAGYAEVYYMDVESIDETVNGGISVTGTMYTNTNSPVYNGVFTVTWDSYESVDWATVEVVNGTEMTDVSMTGEYRYYGPVDGSTDTSAQNTDEYIIPDSDSRYLTYDDIAGMDASQIRLAINEIYARHGRIFQTEDLNEYFSSKSWYTPIYTQEEFAAIEGQIFNEYEKANIQLLGSIRDAQNGQSSFTTDYIYGTYMQTMDAGSINLTVGYYTGSGEDYIELNGSYGDSAGYFLGTVVSSNGNSYTAVDENGNVVDFIYNGLNSIEVTNADNTGGLNFPGFEGTYTKISENIGS